MSDNKIRVGITLGDVNGIGPEVVIKTFADVRMAELCTPVIYGSSKVLSHYKKDIEGADNFQYSVVANVSEVRTKRVNVINCMADDLAIEPGVSARAAGEAAVAALRAAVADLKAGKIDVVVTAPINKENVQAEDFGFKGHTEFFAAEFGGEPLMMMCSELLKVGLVTTHMPLHDVSGAVTAEMITGQLVRLRKSLVADFGVIEPRLAVLSLNPHSGDGGLLGEEEQTIIKPAMDDASTQGVLAFGPFPSDGFFAAAAYTKYDAVLSMYHDQGLTPFKALTPQGVNFTAGLPVVRTSPDHGVAYDIAGQDKADPASMREAVYLAIDVWRNRRRYAEMTRNPLQRFERERGGRDMSVSDLLPEPEHND